VCVSLCGVPAACADLESVRERWRGLQDQESHVLAPRTHREAAATMRSLESSPSSAKELADAEKQLQALDVAVRRARSLWTNLLEVRERARAAGAPARDPRGWTTAENILVAAAQKLEGGRTETAQSQAREALPAYEAARRNAMRVELLGTVDSLRVGLEADKAQRIVPRSWVRTVDAIAAAERLLRERDELDAEVRAAGSKALSEARHARFLLDRILGACEEKAPDRIESAILDWEEATRRALVVLGLESSFESGLGPPLAAVEREAAQLRTERDRLRIATRERAGTADSLGERVQALRDRLRDRELQVAALQRSLADYQTIDEIGRMFGPDDGRVLVDGRDLVLRLHGLQFASGSAELPSSSGALLDKVVQALERLPGARVIVEGHTDSQGRPEANVELSQARAIAVRDELARRARLHSGAVKATGYGAMRPVASNETAEGRALNRRIEIVIARPE
jgi:outer membrane protein OmpA-like peptidoglycan-associated protein